MTSSTWIIYTKMHMHVFISTNTSEEDVCLLQTNSALNICKNIQPLFLDQHLITKCVILSLQMPLYLPLQGRTDFFSPIKKIQNKGFQYHPTI